jgi:hypothetical protein
MTAAVRQARAKQALIQRGGRRTSVNLPAEAFDDLSRIKERYSLKDNSDAIIAAVRWYARMKQ